MIAKTTGLPKTTVYDVINRFKGTLSVKCAAGRGRKPGASDKNLAQKIVRSCKQNPGLSDEVRAQRYQISRSTAKRRRLEASYKQYRAVKVPNRNDKQVEVVKTRVRTLYDKVLTKHQGCIMMDDETPIKADFRQLPGPKFYTAQERLGVADKYKFIKLDKFGKKMMIWQAICSCGLKSEPLVTTSTFDSKFYIENCLQKRLLPFIRRHDVPVKFWPDLASCHYSKSTMKWYEENGVDVVTKDMNPPNCPEFRPIENFWGIVKKDLKKTGSVVQNEKQMLGKWKTSAEKVTKELVQDMMAGIKRKVREYIRTGNMKC